jgi:hypothetical protein
MEESGSEYSPVHAGTPRRGLFRRQDDHTPGPQLSIDEQRAVDAMQQVVDVRVADGLRALEEQAAALMREVASEMWRASGSDARPEQERIVSLLSRDQAIRSLISSSDERFQSLAVKAARLEDHVTELAEAGRATRASMEASAESIREIADSPTLHGVDTVRTQLQQVEAHISATFQHLDERDHVLTDTILRQVREHGDLIARETSRIVEAMEGYVQGGTEAVGRLAQRIEQHAEAFAVQDIHIADNVRESIAAETAPLQQELELLSERVGLHGRAQQDVQAAVERLVETRMRGLAELIRSDSLALRKLIEERQGTVAAGVDADAMTQAISETLQVRLTSAELRLQGELENVVDRNMAQLARQLDERLDSLGETVAHRVAGTADVAEMQTVAEDRLMSHVDDRMTAIGRLIRSDNQALADRLLSQQPSQDAAAAVDPELMRETLRTMKELQAGLANEMVGSIDTRFRAVSDQLHHETQSTAEAMVKVAEVLGEKIDRLSVRMDEGYGTDLQVVIDRMSDAIQAMSMAGRPQRFEQLG